MPNLQFNQLLVLSNSEKSGNQFQFGPAQNLITAKDNNVGKSTLVELLFWTFGCEMQFDTKWINQDCKTILRFSIGTFNFAIKRYKNQVSVIQPDGSKLEFSKISGDYARWFAETVGFKALLPSRTDELQTPPPAYFFIPFYIDQKKSWIKAWEGFENLAQYDNWKQTIIKYHVGLLTPEYFEIEKDKYDKKLEQRIVKADIEKLDVTLDVIEGYIPPISEAVTTNVRKFELMTDEIRNDMASLSILQEKLLNNLTRYQAEYSYQSQQRLVSAGIIKDLDKDYIFSVENIEADVIECPICGTIHDNSVYNKAGLLADKQEAENQLAEIDKNLASLDKKLKNTHQELAETKEKIATLNEKYIVEEEGETVIALDQIIENIAGKAIKIKAGENRAAKVVIEADLKKQIKALKKEQTAIIDKIDEEEILSSFNRFFNEYISVIGAEDINAAEIISPLSYNKVSKEGGAAENVRAMLAYYLTIYSLIEKYGPNIRAPFVIDTPNQHEQSDTNYEKIIQLLIDNYPKSSQMFLCAMDNSQISKYRILANVIELDNNKILHTDQYNTVKAQFDEFESNTPVV